MKPNSFYLFENTHVENDDYNIGKKSFTNI